MAGHDVDHFVVEAKQRWAQGRRDAALESIRRAALLAPRRADLWYLNGQWAIEAKRSDVAYVAVRNALDVRPWHLGAYELLVELVRSKDKSSSILTQALDALVRELPAHPELHRSALDFLVPQKHVDGIRIVAQGSDAVAARAAQMFLEQRVGETPSASAPPVTASEQRSAELLYALAIGRTGRAVALLDETAPAEVPVDALRRAIRRSLARGQDKRSGKLLREYARVRPGDGWARTNLKAIERRQERSEKPTATGAPTNYQLAKRGFPFGKRSQGAAYDPNPRSAFYLLHNSLPYSSAGYATRSHGLLRQLSTEWDMRAVTRLGFPFDTPGHDELERISGVDVIDGVTYSRLSTEAGRWQKNPITDYVAQYSEALATLAEEHRPFVIHAASNHWNGLTAVETGRRLGIPSVYEVRGLWEVTRASRNPEWHDSGMYRYVKRMEADAASAADRVITITRGLRDEMIDRGVDAEKIVVVPNGVDTERFTPIPRDVELQSQLGLQGKTIIGYVGSVLDYEGLDLLIRAASRLAGERDDFHVLIVGDGAEKEVFESLAEELGVLGSYVTFTGRVPHADVERYYSLIDIAPFPRAPLPVCELVSPLKPFEAMAMGKAVVSSDVRALAEIVTDGENGLLHAKGDAGSLESVLRRLLDDDALRERLGAQAREWVVRERDWRNLATRVSEIYDGLAVKAEPRAGT
ncbi:glycosyltransferase [Cellulosimicrobium cellulans]|uniref:glycosyltransferase n=1 Tax=Cellulosimicrobium cellulans TaxID=1710 RepID=UPI0036518198